MMPLRIVVRSSHFRFYFPNMIYSTRNMLHNETSNTGSKWDPAQYVAHCRYSAKGQGGPPLYTADLRPTPNTPFLVGFYFYFACVSLLRSHLPSF